MVRNDDYTCLFYLDKIHKFCRESLVKTTVSLNRILLDRNFYVVVKCNKTSYYCLTAYKQLMKILTVIYYYYSNN